MKPIQMQARTKWVSTSGWVWVCNLLRNFSLCLFEFGDWTCQCMSRFASRYPMSSGKIERDRGWNKDKIRVVFGSQIWRCQLGSVVSRLGSGLSFNSSEELTVHTVIKQSAWDWPWDKTPTSFCAAQQLMSKNKTFQERLRASEKELYITVPLQLTFSRIPSRVWRQQ